MGREFQQYNLVIKYRSGSQAIVPDAISRRPDFNALVLQTADDYVPYVRQFLETKAFLTDANATERAQIVAEASKFVHDDGVLFRKLNEGIIAAYIDSQSREDLT